ncbi:ribonuclease domain-containing protein [Corynebacterium neomassiliense]|uniref:ribonuclease domain-containing protein n=1 Tax=Corynebacterium neomassiliense TaxID=2079482 RepID=UPI00102FA0A0|nr:ribonuclease domain-containing protein [Corynebacterium neomassiliense]
MSGNSRKTLGTVAGVVVAAAAVFLGVDTVAGGDGSTDTTGAAGTASTTARAAGAAPATPQTGSGGGSCPVDTLPEQADEVIDAILDGGPFEHGADDGKHFGNYEGTLPREDGSFYREYTVDTPGVGHRGARRIVVGGGTGTDPDVWYYTGDHYGTFCAIPDAEDDGAA